MPHARLSITSLVNDTDDHTLPSPSSTLLTPPSTSSTSSTQHTLSLSTPASAPSPQHYSPSPAPPSSIAPVAPPAPNQYYVASLKPQTIVVKTARGKRHRCTFPGCGRDFSRLSNLKAHWRRHSGEEPYACMHCGRKFKWRSSLKSHELGCVYEFTTKQQQHEQNQTAASQLHLVQPHQSPQSVQTVQSIQSPQSLQSSQSPQQHYPQTSSTPLQYYTQQPNQHQQEYSVKGTSVTNAQYINNNNNEPVYQSHVHGHGHYVNVNEDQFHRSGSIHSSLSSSSVSISAPKYLPSPVSVIGLTTQQEHIQANTEPTTIPPLQPYPHTIV